MRPRIPFSLALALTVLVGCDKSSSPDTEAPMGPPPAAQPEEEFDPGPTSEWGDGLVRGIVRLKWGAPPPEGASLKFSLWRNGEIAQWHEVPATGPGPWAFEFQADDVESFDAAEMFGIGVMLVVPPDGEAWYMGDPPSIQIWKAGETDKPIELMILPIDPRVAGDGPPE